MTNFTDRLFLLYRVAMLATMIVVVILGLGSKFYQGPLAEWVNDSAGDIVYEMFWILAVLFLWPQASPARVSVGVFVVTCIIEFSQLWKPAFLEAIRATFVGKLLLGTTFVWSDFPHYLIGCFMTFMVLKYVKPKLVKNI